MTLLYHIAAKVYALLNVNTVDCLTTIFLCTWVAYHPDVPDPKDAPWKTKCKRIGQAILGLLSPESILMLALRDRVFSRRELGRLKKMGKLEDLNWTQTHASFAYMGGFQLRDLDGTEGKVLYKNEFFKSVRRGEIGVPDIKEKEILDKSKTDILGKFIVVFHTLWFLVRFIATPVQVDVNSNDSSGNKGTKYTTFPLGYVTLSLVLVNVCCYACWWNKPTNVGVPIPVLRQEPRESASPFKGEASGHWYSPDLESPLAERHPPHSDEPSPPKKGFWSRVWIVCKKLALFLFLTGVGMICSGANFLALATWPGETTQALWILWPFASTLVSLCSFILYLTFIPFVVFTDSTELVGKHKFSKLCIKVSNMVSIGMSIVVISARLCLIVIASIVAFRPTSSLQPLLNG